MFYTLFCLHLVKKSSWINNFSNRQTFGEIRLLFIIMYTIRTIDLWYTSTDTNIREVHIFRLIWLAFGSNGIGRSFRNLSKVNHRETTTHSFRWHFIEIWNHCRWFLLPLTKPNAQVKHNNSKLHDKTLQ